MIVNLHELQTLAQANGYELKDANEEEFAFRNPVTGDSIRDYNTSSGLSRVASQIEDRAERDRLFL